MKPCVLVVDDDPEFLHALQNTLHEAGFDVRTARDGKEALAVLNQSHDAISVAIIDLNLPEVSGFELIGAITRRPTALRILATTGIYQPTFLEIAKHLGANIAIRKPADFAELRSWIPAIRSVIQAEDGMNAATGGIA